MSNDSFAAKLRNLSKDYYQNHISFNEYRIARKSLLDQVDEEFNGQKVEQQNTQDPVKPSMFMKTISFFANTDPFDKDKSE